MHSDITEPLRNRPYFFDAGIFFQCRRCGRCCSGDPGVVYVSEYEIEEIARFLLIPVSGFIRQFLYPYKDGYSIYEDTRGRCLFYENGCVIYPVRPSQCRTFPFWFDNLRSRQKWLRVEKDCPGIGKGDFFPKEKILQLLSKAV